MKVATSGSRQEPTPVQAEHIRRRILAFPEGTVFITGGCVGVDALIARVSYEAERYVVVTVLPADHRAVDPDWAKHCDFFMQMPNGTSYRERDIRVVKLGDILLAFPLYVEKDGRSRRSGTWLTVRIAKRAGKEVEVDVLGQITGT